MVKVVAKMKVHKEEMKDLENKGSHFIEGKLMKVDNVGIMEPSSVTHVDNQGTQWLNVHPRT